jgi:hypothetical protein
MDTQSVELEKQSSAETFSQQPESAAAAMERSAKDVESIEAGTPIADEYPHGARLAVIVVSLLLGLFLVSLDNVR